MAKGHTSNGNKKPKVSVSFDSDIIECINKIQPECSFAYKVNVLLRNRLVDLGYLEKKL